MLMEAAANARSMDEILKELDIQVDEDYIAKVKENLGESLATRYIDYTRIQEMAAAHGSTAHPGIYGKLLPEGICEVRREIEGEARSNF